MSRNESDLEEQILMERLYSFLYNFFISVMHVPNILDNNQTDALGFKLYTLSIDQYQES